MKRFDRLGSTFLCCLVATACDSSAPVPTPDGITRRDSAGIEIVESRGPASGRTFRRAVSSPRPAIGATSGSPDAQLYRVAGAARLGDGTIAVANGGTSEIRFFHPDGRVTRAGREGDGPGEYGRIGAIDRLPADSLLVWDDALRRLTVLDPDGRVARTFRLDSSGEGTMPTFEGRFRDGSLLARASGFGEPPVDFQVAGSDPLYVRYGPGGELRDSLGFHASGRSVIRTFPDGGFTWFDVPFFPMAHLAAADTVLLVSRGPSFELRSYGSGGRLVRIARRAWSPVVVDDALLDAHFSRAWADVEDPARLRLWREAVDKMAIPDRVPAVDRLLVDRAGRAWARHYVLPDADGATWSVFDRDGGWMGEVALPASLRIVEIGEAYVLGLATDELGVERVELLDLVPAGPAADEAPP